jgi:multidrug efflux pump subunit AcrA (membrane-fusion protein)
MPPPPATDPPFLDPDPPHWAARGLWYVLVLGFAVALVTGLVVDIPDLVSGRFTLVPHEAAVGRLRGELLLPEAGVPLVEAGQAVRLRLDAFPYQRYGVRTGIVRSAAAPGEPVNGQPTFRARFDLDDSDVAVEGRARPLLPGMGGRADVVVGRRSLLRYVLGSR